MWSRLSPVRRTSCLQCEGLAWCSAAWQGAGHLDTRSMLWSAQSRSLQQGGEQAPTGRPQGSARTAGHRRMAPGTAQEPATPAQRNLRRRGSQPPASPCPGWPRRWPAAACCRAWRSGRSPAPRGTGTLLPCARRGSCPPAAASAAALLPPAQPTGGAPCSPNGEGGGLQQQHRF